jgi:clan AA aspartic protease
MIAGTVNADREATLRLAVQDVSGQLHAIEAVIDTGFNGFLTLTADQIDALGLPWLFRQEGELANGSIQVFDVYAATVEWDGQAPTVEVESVDAQPLIGMELMHGFELRVHVTRGGTVALLPVS